MEQVRVERLAHIGVLASLIQDLGLVNMSDTRRVPAAHAMMTPGDAVAGMILQGLGLAQRPLSFTPQCLANKPRDRLLRHGIDADMCTRVKLGRPLDAADADGCDLWCEERALSRCAHEGLDLRCHHLDTTRVALTGEYVPDRDEDAMRLPQGSSQEHRPDLQQAVWERMVSQDGGVPLVRQSWDGHTSDTQGFQKRAEALRRAFKDTPRPRDLVADAKLSGADNAVQLATLGFITRVPATLKLVSQVMAQALQSDTWPSFDDTTRDQSRARCHDGLAQRGLVVSSPAA
jgi:transposase